MPTTFNGKTASLFIRRAVLLAKNKSRNTKQFAPSHSLSLRTPFCCLYYGFVIFFVMKFRRSFFSSNSCVLKHLIVSSRCAPRGNIEKGSRKAKMFAWKSYRMKIAVENYWKIAGNDESEKGSMSSDIKIVILSPISFCHFRKFFEVRLCLRSIATQTLC